MEEKKLSLFIPFSLAASILFVTGYYLLNCWFLEREIINLVLGFGLLFWVGWCAWKIACKYEELEISYLMWVSIFVFMWVYHIFMCINRNEFHWVSTLCLIGAIISGIVGIYEGFTKLNVKYGLLFMMVGSVYVVPTAIILNYL